MTIRIWHQSITDLTLLPGYAGMLKEHARKICGQDTTVDLHGLKPGTYPEGVEPIVNTHYRWAHYITTVQIVEKAMQAEREGYDAVAVSCFLDPGLEEARSVVDIPVISSCETALLTASAIGRAYGLLTIDGAMTRRLRELVLSYGFQDRVTTIAALDPPLTESDMDAAFSGSPEFVERFARQVLRSIGAAADVIIPAEGVLNSLLVRNNVRDIGGVPVLDSYGALLAFAEMLVQLRRKAGLSTARRGAYARPDKNLIRHLRRVTGDVLREIDREADE